MADKAIQKGYTKRYLPEKAWASLSKEERQETDQKKRAGSREGKQFIPNTEKAKKAGRAARRYKQSKSWYPDRRSNTALGVIVETPSRYKYVVLNRAIGKLWSRYNSRDFLWRRL